MGHSFAVRFHQFEARGHLPRNVFTSVSQGNARGICDVDKNLCPQQYASEKVIHKQKLQVTPTKK